jgi:uncharacterized membrane protein
MDAERWCEDVGASSARNPARDSEAEWLLQKPLVELTADRRGVRMPRQAPTPETKPQNFSMQGRASTQDPGKTRHAITIGRTPQDVYLFWRNFSNLALFMKDLKQVQVLSPTLSRWQVELKSGRGVEWNAEITEDIPGERIRWASQPEAQVETSGSVQFQAAPGLRGTVVQLSMDYAVPGGKMAEWAAFFTGEDPDTLVLTNLKRLKQVLETGEYATTEGQPSGREEQSTYVMTH